MREHGLVFVGEMVRVDVPAVPGIDAFAKLFGPNAIYAITPTTEETARNIAANIRAVPFEPWLLAERYHPQTRPNVEDDEFGLHVADAGIGADDEPDEETQDDDSGEPLF